MLKIEKMKNQDQSEILNQEEAARFLKLSVPSIRKFVAENIIPCRRIGKRYLFSKSALLRWVENEENDIDKNVQNNDYSNRKSFADQK